MTVDKVTDFLDRLSFRIRKNTFVVLDNASIYRCRLMREPRQVWEKCGLFLSPPPHYIVLTSIIAYILWQMAEICGLLLHRFPALCKKNVR